MSEPTAALSAGRPGALVGGRYRLQELVGRGGSAQVWSAEDEQLGRRVAVKIVTTSGGEDAGRVASEARLLARLSHPGLVPVYDAGTDTGGRPWVVMELVVGETLADAVARGPMPPERVAQIGRVLAEALAYVHGEGLVHRDVKPANVLLGRDGRVRLTDFGIARLIDAARVTATGLTVGTASYLSPEQVTGAHVGPLSDVYSLGLVLLECLTGHREYPGTAVETALARLSRNPQVPPTLPSGWPGLLAQMTSKEPGPRPTAYEAARELAAIASGGTASAIVPPPVLPADTAVTEVLGRTQVLRTPPPVSPPMSRPVAQPVLRSRYEDYAPPPAAVQPAPPSRNGWPWVFLLVAIVLAAVVGFFVYDRLSSSTGPDTPSISTQLPQQLQDDLARLRDAVRSS